MGNKVMILLAASPSDIPGNGGIRLDSSVTLAIIVALTSLIAPIFVALINNVFQARQRRKEREHEIDKRKNELSTELEKQKTDYDYKIQMHKYDSYYKNQTLVFEQVLEKVGDLLGDTENKDKYSMAMSCINKAFAYSDEKLTSKLDDLKIQVGQFGGITTGDCSIVTAFESLKEVADQMNIILKKNANIE